MKKKILILALLFLIWPKAVDAHMIGQPPYFKIDGVFTNYYPVPSTSLENFNLPQDIATDSALINDPIKFEIDVDALPVPAEIVKDTEFTWDFGDGISATGLVNTHTYSKPGTFILSIRADSGEGMEPQLLQTTAINILPDKNYILPKSIIKVNNWKSKDPLTDILELDLNKEISFDGSESSGGNSKITEYIWDLGDGNSKSESTFKYKYGENPYIAFPVLRVKTEDGFFADSFVQLTDKSASSSVNDPFSNLPDFKVILISAILALILTALFFTVAKRFSSNKR